MKKLTQQKVVSLFSLLTQLLRTLATPKPTPTLLHFVCVDFFSIRLFYRGWWPVEVGEGGWAQARRWGGVREILLLAGSHSNLSLSLSFDLRRVTS